MDSTKKSICQRANIFYKEKLLLEDTSCCCTGQHCANVLFDQQMNGKPVPFIHVELDESDASKLSGFNVGSSNEINNDKDNIEIDKEPQHQAQVQSAGFELDWSFTPIETTIIVSVVLILLVIVVTVSLWFVYDKEQKNDLISGLGPQRNDFDRDHQFVLKRSGRTLY